MVKEKILKEYKFKSNGLPIKVRILMKKGNISPVYDIKLPALKSGTKIMLNHVIEEIVEELKLNSKELTNQKETSKIKESIEQEIKRKLRILFPQETEEKINFLTGAIMPKTMGLGPIEHLINDNLLEEIVIRSNKPLWVYHREFGWLRTNIIISEQKIYDYAALIARQVGRQISTLDPLLDAHMLNGDRINAVLSPVSSFGNTITIRKFRRTPWTITELISNNTIPINLAAQLWLLIQYEMSIIVSGGTASGKTTMLNTLLSFAPPNQRILSIEETRELQLPEYLFWDSLVVKEPNPEGKGEVSMQDLLVNSLRMRPDRIVVGEVRRSEEARTLFEALHTGHSVYSTIHADTSEQTLNRLMSEPINIPESMVSGVPIILVMIRDRRKGIRRVFEFSEVVPTAIGGKSGVRSNILWRWRPRKDIFKEEGISQRVYDDLKLHTGLSDEEIKKDLQEKEVILEWMVRNKIFDNRRVGNIFKEYYENKEELLVQIKNNSKKLLKGF